MTWPSDQEQKYLYPCPFCGMHPVKLRSGDTIGMAGSQTWDQFVECPKCWASGPRFVDGAFQPEGRPQEAMRAWNIRTKIGADKPDDNQ